MPKLRVAGVPEHFNFPWKIAIEEGLFDNEGIEVEWIDVPNGTGDLIAGLERGDFDLILALTEGIVSKIVNGSDMRIISTYVRSPLKWGIITGTESPYHEVEDLKDQTFGVSRLTSGSHLMACVLALERGWHPQSLKFDVQGDFKSLREGVRSGKSAAFLWNYSTTKPFVRSGEVRFIGDITTPWSCFMMAGKPKVLAERKGDIDRMFNGIRKAAAIFHERDNMVDIVSERYGILREDVVPWYSRVSITASSAIGEESLQRAVDALYQAKVINTREVDLKTLIDPAYAHIESVGLKSIRLYSKPELLKFLRNNLIREGLVKGPLNYKQLLPFDQHHYHGTEAIDQFASLSGLARGDQVLNIGSGLGGPARYLSGALGNKVVAVDIQEDLHRAAEELTSRCGLADSVRHICGDILDVSLSLSREGLDGTFKAIVSWLTLLHIADRSTLLKRSLPLLKPRDGVFFVEDFYEKQPLSVAERDLLEREVFARDLDDMNTYKDNFRKAGFEIVSAEDITDDWTQYTRDRVQRWEENKEALVGIHRLDTYERLLSFYRTVRDLFEGRNLGGLRIIARRPSA